MKSSTWQVNPLFIARFRLSTSFSTFESFFKGIDRLDLDILWITSWSMDARIKFQKWSIIEFLEILKLVACIAIIMYVLKELKF